MARGSQKGAKRATRFHILRLFFRPVPQCGPRGAQEVPKGAQKGSRGSQGGPKRGPKEAKEVPKEVKGEPRGTQKGSRGSPGSARWREGRRQLESMGLGVLNHRHNPQESGSEENPYPSLAIVWPPP